MVFQIFGDARYSIPKSNTEPLHRKRESIAKGNLRVLSCLDTQMLVRLYRRVHLSPWKGKSN